MNYQLAKELKDAGFPFDFGGIITNDCLPPVSNFQREPTLSKLIEACVDRFDELYRMRHYESRRKYSACAYECEDCGHMGNYIEIGATPEEAVARVWLALNKK